MVFSDTGQPFRRIIYVLLLLPVAGAVLIFLDLPEYGLLLTLLRFMILLAVLALATGMILLIKQVNKH